jgi:hypothetical protein
LHTYKVTAHWAQKLPSRKLQRYAFLDSEATSGAAPEKDEQDLDDAGNISRKTFMFLDGRTGKAAKKMLLKHNLQLTTREMNMLPGLHSALVSIPRLADAGYTMALTKNGTAIYDDNTTAITAVTLPSWNPTNAYTPEYGD